MNNQFILNWQAIGVDDDRARFINSRIDKRLGSKVWRRRGKLQTWFPQAKGEAREAHEILQAATLGLLRKDELQNLQDLEPEPEPEPEQPGQPGEEEGPEGQPGEPQPGEGEGEGEPGEGEGQGDQPGEGEGEGDQPGEGEGQGDQPGEGEGEGDQPGEGEGEGDQPGEGEGEQPEPEEGELTGEQQEASENGEATKGGGGNPNHGAHVDDAAILQAINSLASGSGDPIWAPGEEITEAATKASFSYWRQNLSRLVNRLRRNALAIARNKCKRYQRSGRLDLKDPVRIATDSPYCFQRKLRGTNRRVAVATMMDYSGSMQGSTKFRGEAAAKRLITTLRRVGLTEEAAEFAKVLQSPAGDLGWEPCLSVHMNGSHAFGNRAGLSHGKSEDSKGGHRVYLSINKGHESYQCTVNEPVLAQRLAALFQRLHGQWIGANLIRRAFEKCGIANYWGAFTGDSHKVKGWNDRGLINPPTVKSLGNSTCTASAMRAAVRELRTRREERRIAVIFSDGSFGVRTATSDNAGNASANKPGEGEFKTAMEFCKEAWSEGIEVYYIGIHVSDSEIASAESILGKGHAAGVTDIATELPALLDSIIGMDERDLRKTADGKGYKLKR